MECEEFILPDWSPPDNPIQSERAKRASSSLMGCEELIFPDWSPPNDPARVLAAEGRRNPSDDNDDDGDDVESDKGAIRFMGETAVGRKTDGARRLL